MQILSELPAGVHVLSAESKAALYRAAARYADLLARHKPARLAAATHPSKDV
jgi:hypothetical protein